ncbi:uncharacterized protein LOC132735548 [Ruditapes philippinarum]|uniref:uncharacterized protein LOC132735548 n=1 Tax=Ruditapes philippinarum TaxID=129788 RepID=UPI00295AF19F|nr:uncharacterized protein LOC132735548 [Ruditapes philippinarum]
MFEKISNGCIIKHNSESLFTFDIINESISTTVSSSTQIIVTTPSSSGSPHFLVVPLIVVGTVIVVVVAALIVACVLVRVRRKKTCYKFKINKKGKEKFNQQMKTLESNKRINSTDVVDDGELIEVNRRSEYAANHGDGNGEENNCDDGRVISSGDDAGGFENINDHGDEGNNGGKENIGYSDIGEKDDSLVVEDNNVFRDTVCGDGVEVIDDCCGANIIDCTGEENNATAGE